MADNQLFDMTIMLADVAGSVQLYDKLGDVKAHDRIVKCLQIMATIVNNQQGRVVEIIGDEIMSAFVNPDAAIDAACKIQEELGTDFQLNLGVRIGVHTGMTGVSDGHPFGDTVNVAARMVGLAKIGQAIMSKQVHERLSEANKSRSRFFDQVFIKGKQEPYSVYQAIWDQAESTTVMMSRNRVDKPQDRRRIIKSLCLRYKSTEKVLKAGNPELLLGRGKQCGLRVDTNAASRVHATIAFDGEKIALFDRSTNGTYVQIKLRVPNSGDSNLFIHHKELEVRCDGIISLGEPVIVENPNLIRLTCVY